MIGNVFEKETTRGALTDKTSVTIDKSHDDRVDFGTQNTIGKLLTGNNFALHHETNPSHALLKSLTHHLN
jgi:hypothetical protein